MPSIWLSPDASFSKFSASALRNFVRVQAATHRALPWNRMPRGRAAAQPMMCFVWLRTRLGRRILSLSAFRCLCIFIIKIVIRDWRAHRLYTRCLETVVFNNVMPVMVTAVAHGVGHVFGGIAGRIVMSLGSLRASCLRIVV